MIVEGRGNLLAADVDALVNTVNTVGAMGKGLALQFRKAYPAMFQDYRGACDRGEIRTGSMWVWPTQAMSGPRFIINFPTKKHWRGASRLEYIDEGLQDLIAQVRRLEITSIALPPLGTGNGGLSWSDVEPRILAAAEKMPDVRIIVFRPHGAPPASELIDRTPTPELTSKRAALVSLLNNYQQVAVEPTLIEVQKLVYFLQEAGEQLNLDFVAARYGPYADALRRTLIEMEPHYLTGYGDGSRAVMQAEPITVQPGAAAKAEEVLEPEVATRERIDQVLDLVEGFESWYGMELLSTVHWAAHSNPEADVAGITSQIHQWSERKANLFTYAHVQAAWDALNEQGWLAAATS